MTNVKFRASTIQTGIIVSTLVATLTGTAACSSDEDEADSTQICVRQEIRVDDSECEREGGSGGGSNAALWYFLGRGMAAPPVGSKVSGGSFIKPSGTIGRVPASGGFGTRGGTSGG